MMMIMPMATGRGMGQYPGDSCYNPDRPSWLPYWIDTFSEEACRYSETVHGAFVSVPSNPPGGPAPVGPSNAGQMTNPGEFTGIDSTPDYQAWAAEVAKGLNPGMDWSKIALLVGGIIAAIYIFRKVK
jgi:hypothetical protein